MLNLNWVGIWGAIANQRAKASVRENAISIQSKTVSKMTADLPKNEAARLKALCQYKVLDTPPEEAFDDLTQLAAQICKTPVALVSLIDANRQWFKSKVGINALEIPRDHAFCAYTILQPGLLIVSDASADQRFATNPLVTDNPHIRFYAGAPLITSEGYVLGTLSVIDYVPRQLSQEQQAALQALSRQVITQLELRQAEVALRKAHDELEMRVQERTQALERANQTLLGEIAERQRAEESRRKSKEMFLKAFRASPDAISISTLSEGYLIEVNDSFLRNTGYTRKEVIGRTSIELNIWANLEDRNRMTEILQREGTVRNLEFNFCKKSGEIRVALLSAEIIYFDNQPCMLAVSRDITERKQAEVALRVQEEFLRNVIDTTPNLVFVKDCDGRYTLANKAVADAYGTTVENLLGKTDGDFNPNSTQVEQLLRDDREVMATLREKIVSEETVTDSTGKVRWFQAIKKPLISPDGKTRQVLGVATDITQRKQAEAQLIHDALHDQLTGLANRTLFMDRLTHAVEMSKRRQDYVFAVLFLDLDRFKVVNDSLGHLSGDQLLVNIAHKLQTCLRPGDTIARFGGDEFTILLEDVQDMGDTIHVTNQIHKALMFPFNLNGQEVFTSASIGIALSTTGYNQPEDLLRHADIALYRAKALGRARHEIFDMVMHTRAVALLQLETDLRRALQHQEFRLHYQPIVALETGTITGFEALVRWHHPERGLVSPAEFIPVAEETGLIIPIGWWVLREACRQLKKWQASSSTNSLLTVSVNLSGKQFTQPHLAEQIGQTLQETGLDAASLRLEITESVVMENAQSAAATLLHLKKLGVQLYIDDFGTGYSSLSYLHRFPIDTLKIDRSFVSRMSGDSESAEAGVCPYEIVKTIVTLAHNLGLDVVAEGVETAEQLAQLKALNCKYGQGYYFSKPLTPETAGALIAFS